MNVAFEGPGSAPMLGGVAVDGRMWRFSRSAQNCLTGLEEMWTQIVSSILVWMAAQRK